jgi:hypothetical protein
MSKDRRAATRRRIRWKALMLDPTGLPLGECTIVDVSSTGARLALRERTSLPEAFLLVMSRNGGVRRQCELTWYADKSAGVRFLRPQAIEEEAASHFGDAVARLTGHHDDNPEADPALALDDQPA